MWPVALLMGGCIDRVLLWKVSEVHFMGRKSGHKNKVIVMLWLSFICNHQGWWQKKTCKIDQSQHDSV